MNKFMNKSFFAGLCLAALIALLPACGCGTDNQGCQGGTCPVPAAQVEQPKAVDAQDTAVEQTEQAAQASAESAAPAEAPVAEAAPEASEPVEQEKVDKF